MKKIIFCISIILLSNQLFALSPSKTYKITPADYGMNYEEISIVTEDNFTLYGWLFKATDANSPKMVIISDDGVGNMSDMVEIASNFLSLGYNVITYDYRGYGKSQDFKVSTQFFIYSQFEKDLEAAITYARKYHSKCKTLHLYGLGIGAGLSLAVGANRNEVGKIIADSPYSDFETVGKLITENNGFELKFPLGYNKMLMEPKFALESKGGQLQGILLIGGDIEPVYNSAMLKTISKLRGGITSTYTVKGATIETTFTTNKTKYFQEIKKFVE